MKISIVATYYNRKKLFYETLKSITRSKFKDFEFIVVDDCSAEDERIEDFINEFPFLKIIRIEKENKWCVNEIVPLNIGISKTNGDVIVLTCPEVLHAHDILSYINENITEDNYLTISTFGPDAENTNKIVSMLNNNEDPKSFIYSWPTPTLQEGHLQYNVWYNHSICRGSFHHYCSAITRENMRKLNGFDERYAQGIAWGDCEIVERIKRLGLKMIIEDDVIVVHQFHSLVWESMTNYQELVDKNLKLLYNVTYNEIGYTANFGKWIFEQK